MASPQVSQSGLVPLGLHISDVRVPRHQISARTHWNGEDRLELTFEIEGADKIVWPSKQKTGAVREDGLWRSTCFECFIAGPDESYFEWNFSPNGNWAAYSFTKYRTGMRNVAVSAPSVDESVSDGRKKYSIQLNSSELPIVSPMRFSLAAVVLEVDRPEPFYWAVHHAGPKPDFHLSDSFSLRMEF